MGCWQQERHNRPHHGKERDTGKTAGKEHSAYIDAVCGSAQRMKHGVMNVTQQETAFERVRARKWPRPLPLGVTVTLYVTSPLLYVHTYRALPPATAD